MIVIPVADTVLFLSCLVIVKFEFEKSAEAIFFFANLLYKPERLRFISLGDITENVDSDFAPPLNFIPLQRLSTVSMVSKVNSAPFADIAETLFHFGTGTELPSIVPATLY